MNTVDIPVSAARHIAEAYGYDQVVVVARKVGCREHVTTYGAGEHRDVAARMGNFFKHKLMGWPGPGAKSAWVPVSERLPEIGDEVLVYRPQSTRAKVTSMVRLIPYEGSLKFYWDAPRGGATTIPEHVTHWMPHPEPPSWQSE